MCETCLFALLISEFICCIRNYYGLLVVVIFVCTTPVIRTQMQVIGLTGGIGTGKSTACKLLKEIDPQIIIIDADVLSHEATQKGKLPYLILKYLVLPRDCFDPVSGELIRSRLAEMIFAQSNKAALLKKIIERCIHPWIIYKMILSIIWNWIKAEDRIILDIPLLFEAKLQWMCAKTILIDTSDPEVQLKRILKRNPQMSEEQARNRMAAQFPMEKKRKLSDVIIKNDGNINDLRNLLEREFKEKKTGYHQKLIFRIIIILAVILIINKIL